MDDKTNGVGIAAEGGTPPSVVAGRAAAAIAPEGLGSAEFRRDYRVKYAYLAGAMYKGIASRELVVAMGRGGLMGFFGAGGLSLEQVEGALHFIQSELDPQRAYGMNLLSTPVRELEERTVALYLARGVRYVEAAAYIQMTPSLVRYRLAGLRRLPDGTIDAQHRVVAKVSRPEVAEAFMRPAPQAMVEPLVAAGLVTREQAELGRHVPISSEVCVEADSGGHTDRGVAYVLMPAMRALREAVGREQRYSMPIWIGAAGGIGTPEAAAAAFILGADFVVTGSVNQCTVEAGTSDAVKDMLQDMNVQDTAYAPAGDMFELGAKVQVLRKGLFFAARANKLYELYQRYNSLEEIDAATRAQIEQKYFMRSFDSIWSETKTYYAKVAPEVLQAAEKSPKQKMALTFRWYFVHSTRLAMQGSPTQRVDYQVHCGPALGAFNQWVRGTELQDWRRRHVADLGERIMQGAARVLGERLGGYHAGVD